MCCVYSAKNCNPNKHLEKEDEKTQTRTSYPLGIHNLNMANTQSEIGEEIVGGNDIADTNVHSGNGNIQKEEPASSWALIKEKPTNILKERKVALFFF